MTFRELFKEQKGYDVVRHNPAAIPCPHKFGYEQKNTAVCRRMIDCKSCWEREVPEKSDCRSEKVVWVKNNTYASLSNDKDADAASIKVVCGKSALHEKLCAELTDTYRRKNHDYGDSFHQSYIEDGLTMAKIRIGDKYSRFKSLIKSNQMVKDESIRDTLMDMANYCIMTVMEMETQTIGEIDAKAAERRT